jgi:hypothetical protein
MNNYDEIKRLVENSRKMLSSNLNETTEIRKQYSLLTEQPVDINMGEREDEYETADKKEKDSDKIGKPSDKQKSYKILGNVLVLHGKTEPQIQLTTDEKNAFVESVDEFQSSVAELVEFEKMNVYDENVEWSGKISEINLEFFFTINEPHGIYINTKMVKIDQESLEIINKLQAYYDKFKTKWSKIVASRKDKK